VPQANTILILDNARNMRRTMELAAMFDTPEMASQRMRLFPIESSLASTVSKELEEIYGAFSESEESRAIQFVPLERINSVWWSARRRTLSMKWRSGSRSSTTPLPRPAECRTSSTACSTDSPGIWQRR
jgi:type II secretory pathway component GspD/PulD (secretin)